MRQASPAALGATAVNATTPGVCGGDDLLVERHAVGCPTHLRSRIDRRRRCALRSTLACRRRDGTGTGTPLMVVARTSPEVGGFGQTTAAVCVAAIACAPPDKVAAAGVYVSAGPVEIVQARVKGVPGCAGGSGCECYDTCARRDCSRQTSSGSSARPAVEIKLRRGVNVVDDGCRDRRRRVIRFNGAGHGYAVDCRCDNIAGRGCSRNRCCLRGRPFHCGRVPQRPYGIEWLPAGKRCAACSVRFACFRPRRRWPHRARQQGAVAGSPPAKPQ